MGRVAIVTDSASDMDPARAAALGIRVVPLLVMFGETTYSAGRDLTLDEFWTKMTAPGAPLATTAACSPGTFQTVYQEAFDAGADAIVSIHVTDAFSGTIKAANVAKGILADREIHVVDSRSASMGEGVLAELAVQMAADGATATQIADAVTRRRDDITIFLALETLEYLRRGGRISGARWAIGTMLGIKPIIGVRDAAIIDAAKARTRGKARELMIEMLTAAPIERLAVLHSTNAGVEEFTEQLVAKAGIDRSLVTIDLVGASVGPHVGPGCVGAVALYQEGSRPS